MHAELVFSHDDFAFAFSQFTPSRIWLNREKTHWLHLGAVEEVSIDANAGVQIICPAEAQWTVHVKADSLRFHVRPAIEPMADGHCLAFHIAIEEASLRGLLGLFDKAVVAKVDKALAAHVLAWNYSKTLQRTFSLPERLFRDVSGVTLKFGQSSDKITDSAVILSLDVQVGFARRA